MGHDSQVPNPGDFITTTIGTQPVVVTRDRQGTINVILNRCGHRGTKVTVKPCGNTKLFRCPYHGWSFNLDGSLNSTPHKCGYVNTGFDMSDPEYHMRKVGRVEIYQGFVFASLAQSGPDLETFLGKAKETFDNMADRSPEGRLEVAGAPFRYSFDCNWKMYLENLSDTMHPKIAHGSVGHATRAAVKNLPEESPPPLEAEIIFPFGNSYEFMDEMGVTAMHFGHSYMGGKSSIHSEYPELDGYWESMLKSHGEEKARKILSQNRHNTKVYPSFSIQDVSGVMRVIRPIAVDKTLVDVWHLRFVGAPDDMFRRTVAYSHLINSPASMVGHDDRECFSRMQTSLVCDDSKWVDVRRYLNQNQEETGVTTAPGTSELAIRNEYQAWLNYMNEKVDQ
ncbi:aromatic ring-hydroxylating oxygenase subunit alpha [Kineobactrum salinum]|uniref:Rieske 2Fe-2S domain-containing protein n=1 Tax=Kineobactrum salinum TaxID=2708301 RepID=A0A6C0U1R7_9GAMM|nr:Rieske 2Fe-2S domain-containing protein [Kineobactrum salinum]QIB64927.1 Rieske 2Fe-2S domain-containing protein [Kineobactrum salinum]